jgi:hypothetical protein
MSVRHSIVLDGECATPLVALCVMLRQLLFGHLLVGDRLMTSGPVTNM